MQAALKLAKGDPEPITIQNRTSDLPRSWLGYVSPYVRLLEFMVAELKRERDDLQNRLVRMTTGWNLDERVPNQDEIEAEETRKPRTSWELVRQQEADSLKNYMKRLEEEAKQAAKPNGGTSGDKATTD